MLATLGCHMMFAYSFIPPMAIMIVQGFAYSMLASALWPMVAYVIPNSQLGMYA